LQIRRRRNTDVPDVILIVQHGLCGNTQSDYIKQLAHDVLERRGSWQMVVALARGCGDTALTSSSGFTAARTSDLVEVIAHVAAKFPSAKRVCVGFSLGATLLGKYLGEHGQRHHHDHDVHGVWPDKTSQTPGLHAAVMVGPSWDFLVEGKYLNWPFGGWSRNFLVGGLIRYLRRHSNAVSSLVDIDAGCRARTVREFDQAVIVPAHGYASVDEYYADASACRFAHRIRTPTLALSAADDPVCNVNGVASISHLGPGLVVAIAPTGGHLMFHGDYAPELCIAFIDEALRSH